MTAEEITLEKLTKGLSPLQREAFVTLLHSGKPMNSYSLRVRLTTMHALEKRGLVRGRWDGTMVMPEINKVWSAKYRLRGSK